MAKTFYHPPAEKIKEELKLSPIVKETAVSLLNDIDTQQGELAEAIAVFDLLMENLDDEGIIGVKKISSTAAMLFAQRFSTYYKALSMIRRGLWDVSSGMEAASALLQDVLARANEVGA